MKLILTDIEGTTTSISFVHEVLFPYSLERMETFVKNFNQQPEVKKILDTLPGSLAEKISLLENYIKLDKKEKALKDIQGLIWEHGYKTGEILGHVYPDVKKCLLDWKSSGITLAVYSSGSIHAQKLLFKHSIAGDLDQLFSFNFDTSIGHKRETNSYTNIIQAVNIPAHEILFLSDIKEELDAAKTAGMQTMQLIRTNDVITGSHQQIHTFEEIKF